MKKLFMFFYLSILVFFIVNDGLAREKRPGQIPNGSENACANCHLNPAGGGTRTDFGEDVLANFLDGNGDVIWNYALAKLDSDGDGIPNGVELQDANAFWTVGAPAPGLLDRVRNPGDANSFHGDILTVQFESMDPHVGQRFEIRVVDKYDRQELTRQSLAAIPAADFQLFFDGIEPGGSYWVDFYADHNEDGEYDPPSNDHAWRIEVNDVPGDTIAVFTHNTNFTDIEWPYLLTVNFEDMTPHIGQKFEIRLVDQKTRNEIVRKSIGTIESDEFSIGLPGLVQNEDYWVDFYADLNGNGIYDTPSVDHAWRMELEKVEVDTNLTFQHNTSFTDIMWPYQLSLHLSGMNPHLGQMLEMRVIDLLTQKEIGRTKVESIAVPDFVLSVSGIDTSGIYQVDFYSDHNGNGLYDTPATDHAWRMRTEMTAGDTELVFSHNTGFVDINWVYLYTLEVSDLSPHLGQKFEMRIVDQESGKEVGRAHLDEVYKDEFTLSAPGIVLNRIYNVDFYADFNGNGIYDTPPTDHAWRITFNNGDDGDNEDSFQHNTSFTDINWEYLFTLHLSSMNPHLGQFFELRVVDQSDMTEVGAFRVEEIVSPEFSIPIPGIQIESDYNADFYADLSGNGSYDPPPTDHAWRESFTNSTGDYVVEFTHNTNFTDIGFPTAIPDLVSGNGPTAFALEQNYPNPFNPTTSIKFSIPEASNVMLAIFNNLGQKVRSLTEERMSAGAYQVSWDGRNDAGQTMSSGVYFYQIQAGSFNQVKRMILIK
jgi:hypothetical protein